MSLLKPGEKKKDVPFELKNHIEIMETLDFVDLKRGAKVHGFRGYYLKNDAVLLCFAIWQYALEFFGNKGFNPNDSTGYCSRRKSLWHRTPSE